MVYIQCWMEEGQDMSEYSFLTIWKLDASIDRVWQVIVDTTKYPEWWNYVARVEILGAGGERGLGHTERYHWKTSLPYTLVFDTRVTRYDPPHLLEAAATGELTGFGRWELFTDNGHTTVQYTWTVQNDQTLDEPARAACPTSLCLEPRCGHARWRRRTGTAARRTSIAERVRRYQCSFW